MQNPILGIEVDIICIAILLLVFFSYRKLATTSASTHLFQLIEANILFFCVIDIFSLLFQEGSCELIRIFIFLKFVPCSLLGITWLGFVYSITQKNTYKLRKGAPLIAAPILLVNMLAFADLIENFYDCTLELNVPLWIGLNATIGGYIIAASIIAICAQKNCKNNFLREQYRFLAIIAVIPLIAIGIQSKFLTLPLSQPILVLTLLHLNLSSLRKQISIDPVTGVNNINKLASHLEELTGKPNLSKRLFYIQIGIDNIFIIKKKFGIEKVSEILNSFAKFLRKQGDRQKLFIARKDLDHFALVCERENFAEIESLCNSLVREGETDEMQDILPWHITFSIYWSEYGSDTPNIDSLLNMENSNCFRAPNPKNV